MSSSGCYKKWPCLIAQQMALKRAIKELITVMQLFIYFYGILPLGPKKEAVRSHHKMVSRFQRQIARAGQLLRAFPGYQFSGGGEVGWALGLPLCFNDFHAHHPLRRSRRRRTPPS